MGNMCPTGIMNTQNLQGGLGHFCIAPSLVYGRKVFVAALLGHPGHDATHQQEHNTRVTLLSCRRPETVQGHTLQQVLSTGENVEHLLQALCRLHCPASQADGYSVFPAPSQSAKHSAHSKNDTQMHLRQHAFDFY